MKVNKLYVGKGLSVDLTIKASQLYTDVQQTFRCDDSCHIPLQLHKQV